MSIHEILAGGGGIIFIVLTLVQVSKIEINPWSWIAKIVGRAINGEVIEKVDKLDHDLQVLKAESEEREAITCRTRILRFGDEIMHTTTRHTKEHFDQILTDIKYYEDYCDTHVKFRNNIAVATIKHIKSVYQNCLKNNSFL